jgi:hypothetical protein
VAEDYGEAVTRVLVLGFVVVMVGFGIFIAAVAIRHRTEGRGLVAWGLAYAGFNIAVAAIVVVGEWSPGALRYVFGLVLVALLAKVVTGRRLRVPADVPQGFWTQPVSFWQAMSIIAVSLPLVFLLVILTSQF